MMKTSKFLLICLTCLMLVLGLACAEATPSVTLDVHEADLAVGRRLQLSATLAGCDAKTRLHWETSDAAVAPVKGNTVSGKAPGTAVVTCSATLPDGTVISDACTVRVYLPVGSVQLSPVNVTVDVGHAFDGLKATIRPASATDHTLVWSSADESIATVDEAGVITGVKAGETRITATARDGSGKSAAVKVTVVQPVEEIRLSQSSAMIPLKGTLRLTATTLPADAKAGKITWTSSDDAVAVVKNGTVIARKGGTAVITASCTRNDGSQVTASCTVEVRVPVAGVKLPRAAEVNVGEKLTLAAEVSPADAYDPSLTWSSSDESILTVDRHGVITAHKPGTATVTATTRDALLAKPRTASIAVKVIQPVKTVLIGKDLRLARGAKLQAQAAARPTNATNTALSWTSSDPKIASVNRTGMLTGVGVGECIITASATDGSGKSASMKVTVFQSVSQLIPSTTGRIVITRGKTATVSATLRPADATDKTIRWSSSNNAIASVEEGVITGNTTGNAVITASATDGSGCKAEFLVTVEPANPVTISNITVLDSYRGDTNVLLITPYNHNRIRTVVSFRFNVDFYDGAGEMVKSTWREWSGLGFDPIAPGECDDSGDGYWPNLYGIDDAFKIGLTVTSVTFDDGTTEFIPQDSRTTTIFR